MSLSSLIECSEHFVIVHFQLLILASGVSGFWNFTPELHPSSASGPRWVPQTPYFVPHNRMLATPLIVLRCVYSRRLRCPGRRDVLRWHRGRGR